MQRIIILILLLASVKCFSQVTGYLGKRIIISYAADLKLRTYTEGPPVKYYKNLDNEKDELFYMMHNLGFDFAYSKSLMLGIRIKKASGALEFPYFNPSMQEIYGFKADSREYGFRATIFPFIRNGHIAPLGNYTGVDVFYQNIELELEENQYKESYPGLGVFVGKTSIVLDRFIISRELRTSWAFNLKESPDIIINNSIFYMEEARLLFQSLSLRIGIGLLL